MNGTHAERMPALWIIENPWLRNAFCRQAEAEAAPGVAVQRDRQPITVDVTPAGFANMDADVVSRALSEIDEQQLARVCAALERHLTPGSLDDMAALHKAAAIGLAIGCALRPR
jgi:hypothetical protein